MKTKRVSFGSIYIYSTCMYNKTVFLIYLHYTCYKKTSCPSFIAIKKNLYNYTCPRTDYLCVISKNSVKQFWQRLLKVCIKFEVSG